MFNKKGFAIVFVVIICLLASFLFSYSALAQSNDENTTPADENSEPSAEEGGTPGGGAVDLGAPIGGTERTNLAGYIVLIYNFAVVAGISLAVLVIIFSGYKYMMSSGDPQSLEEAKELLVGAIVGLILIFLTRLILGSIDSRLVQIEPHPPRIDESFIKNSDDSTPTQENSEPTDSNL